MSKQVEEKSRVSLAQTVNCILNPRSVAVIGASTDADKEMKTGWVGRLVRTGYAGKVYPINPKAHEILGIPAFPSVGTITEPIDYAVIAVRRHLVAEQVRECVAKGVKVVHIFTAGFSETGTEEGRQLQERVADALQAGETRLI